MPLNRARADRVGPTYPRAAARPAQLLFSAALFGLASFAHASPVAPISDWREANDSVGQFQRGHIDLLRWEAQHLPATLPAAQPAPGVAPEPALTLNAAIVAAQRTRPELLARPGLNDIERGQLLLKQRELALQVERAWLQAIAARQHVAMLRQALQATEAGHELGARMARVGNWPESRQQRESLALLDAQAQLRKAQHQALAAVMALWQLTGGQQEPVTLAERLPVHWATEPAQDLAHLTLAQLEQSALDNHPEWALKRQQAERAARATGGLKVMQTTWQRLTAPDPVSGKPQKLPTLPPGAIWPHPWEEALKAEAEWQTLERRIRADVRLAYSAWRIAQTTAIDAAPAALRLHTALAEDMQQRYNGMFKSTWELLDASRDRLQAAHAKQQAQLDAALALAELRAVLDGLPYTGSAPQMTAAPAAGKGK